MAYLAFEEYHPDLACSHALFSASPPPSPLSIPSLPRITLTVSVVVALTRFTAPSGMRTRRVRGVPGTAAAEATATVDVGPYQQHRQTATSMEREVKVELLPFRMLLLLLLLLLPHDDGDLRLLCGGRRRWGRCS